MSSIYARLPVSGHYLRKRLRLAGTARRLAGFSIVLMITTIVVYRLGSILPQALIGLLLLAGAMASIALVLSLYGLLRVWFQAVEGGGRVLGGLVMSVIALMPFAFASYLAETNPRTNVAYTQGVSPDEIGSVLDATDAAAAHSSAAAAVSQLPSVVPGRRYLSTAPRVFRASQTVLADRGWPMDGLVAGDPESPANAEPAPGDLGVTGAVTIPLPTFRESALTDEVEDTPIAESDRYRFDVVARDFLFALPSDMDVRIAEDGGETFVELQSRSRATGIDLGQNRRFIEAFLGDLDAAMAGLETVSPEG